MKNTRILFCTLGIAALFWTALRPAQVDPLDEKQAVAELLLALGDEPAPHQPDLTIEGVSAERGYELLTRGITAEPDGGKTGKQSKHFVCTSCHNIQREDPDLSRVDPQARLTYAAANGLPYLPATTLYGAVNRETFYNGDYEEKYGELVIPARNDLREAIQLCAIECSQGRRLESWELESVLAYLWEIDLEMGDLQLSGKEKEKIREGLEQADKAPEAIRILKSAYLPGAPATFVKPPADRKAGYADVQAGDPENGRLIYELSCLHCHEQERYAFFNLDHSETTFRYLKKHFPKYTRYSPYQVIRYGTQPVPGKRAYMPNYTQEKLTNQQVEDLRAYVEAQAIR